MVSCNIKLAAANNHLEFSYNLLYGVRYFYRFKTFSKKISKLSKNGSKATTFNWAYKTYKLMIYKRRV